VLGQKVWLKRVQNQFGIKIWSLKKLIVADVRVTFWALTKFGANFGHFA
jgi:hypothetical protein